MSREIKFRAWDVDCHRFEYFERAIKEARHYILMDTDTFAVSVGDILIRREK